MKETMLDKCIKTNLKMVDNEIALACTMGVLLCLMRFWAIILGLIPIVIAAIFLWKMCRKLFYASVFGETAATYQSLPASAEEVVASKIFVAGLGFIALNVSIMVMMAVISVNLGYGNLLGVLDALGLGVNSLNAGYILPLEFLAVVVECFWQSAVIFLAVVIYNTLPEPSRKGFGGGVLVPVVAVGINYLFMNISSALEFIGLPYGILYPLIGITIGAVTLVIIFRLTVKLLEERYELN